ncbi:MAG: putative flippase GtrA [Candidatus Azotimanducaceae bacterium]|jgi:putative flippase GtrA
MKTAIGHLRELMIKHEQIIRFLIAGGYNTVFGLAVFSGLYLYFEDQFHYLVIAAIANVLAITNGFFVYRYFVFRSTGNLLLEYIKIYAVYGVAFAINLVVLMLLVEFVSFHPIAGQVVIVFVTTIVSYFGHSRFTFAPSGLNQEPSAGLNKKPSAGLNKEPSAGLNKKPSAGLNKKPLSGLNKETPTGPSQKKTEG